MRSVGRTSRRPSRASCCIPHLLRSISRGKWRTKGSKSSAISGKCSVPSQSRGIPCLPDSPMRRGRNIPRRSCDLQGPTRGIPSPLCNAYYDARSIPQGECFSRRGEWLIPRLFQSLQPGECLFPRGEYLLKDALRRPENPPAYGSRRLTASASRPYCM